MRATFPSSTRRRNVRVACLLGACVSLAACGEKQAKGEGPYAELVAEFVPKIEKETGLPFKTPPKIESRTRDEVGKFVRQQLESERARKQLTGQESAYKLLGMLPDTMNLLGLLQKLLEEQIVGYYDPATKVLYVVAGAAPALLRQTVSHELVHALQDQYVKIDSVQAQVDNADRQAAAQAVLEGEAVFLQLRMDPNAGPMLKMPGGWDRIRDAMKDAQTGMPVFSAAPRAVREGLLFPYIGGADFVRRFIEKRPEKELLLDLPISTKQILNDAAYFTDSKATRDLPVAVTLPAPRTGTVLYSNSFGEFETRLMLVQHLKDEALARRGAGGGDGDKFAVVRTADGDALIWATAWDSAVDAADFLDLMGDAARRRYELARIAFPGGATTRQYDVPAKGPRPARTVTLRLEQVNGQPVVIYMDTPAKIGTALIDLAGITVAR
ncbi:hypothetical protein [Gemmatimonas sp.]|uniref:hypothetical protein n=1 Tax=Gemmatimonas sp. TaxID=1962908 RepID=UPI00286C06FD|nr:hypothetical protein [Gemmatimonas sp.]